ncbi:LuxR family transcriptional regulator [Actinoplanes sp. TRM 88003]|uniref:LuxR family transcriptional regulator n=1 Tax=Paractinoplanes aksuensis TaxID=2939490 RepID=A0ABT1DKI7_9ACTN|nr:LuxR family transcriptional regulator [Actinoplanes aksuensis]MCO8271353.1 LuxR family transcriptional regulator [Actinoplanes aksuensis]
MHGRGEILATIESRLATGGGVALYGPAGIGKTVLLEAVATAAEARGELVVWLRPVRSEKLIAYAGIADLIAQLPQPTPPQTALPQATPPETALSQAAPQAALSRPQRSALAALRQGMAPRAGAASRARRLVLPQLLAQSARLRPVLLVLDDCQWLDAESADLIAFAMRRRPGPGVRVVAAERRPGPGIRVGAVERRPGPEVRVGAAEGRSGNEVGVRTAGHRSGPEVRVGAAERRSGPEVRVGVAGHRSGPEVRVAAAERGSGREVGVAATERGSGPEVRAGAAEHRANPDLRVIAAQRHPSPITRRRAIRLCPAPAVELEVPPLAADDLTALLEARGLPCRVASRMHEVSAGNPFLALSLGAALPPGPAWRPSPLPEPARELLLGRLTGLPRPTLLLAALAARPTVALLLRAGREDAVRDLRLAAEAGAVTVDGEQIRFTPPLLATVIAEDASAVERAEAHAALAAGAVDDIEALRHQALRSSVPDAAVARALATAAQRCAARGAGRTAAELFLLAADRCPHTCTAHRLDWLVAAARSGLSAGLPALAGRAAEAVLAADAPAAHRVQARLVLIDLAGQGLAEMGEMVAVALEEAGDDSALSAPVRLRMTWAFLLTGDPDRAGDEAARTALAARRAGDPATEAMALSVLAQIQRLCGDPGWSDTLTEALVLPAAPAPDWLHYGPRYVAARFAMMDDRLDEARAALLSLLAVAGPDRVGEARVCVLRSLSEVATRAGRCREALDYAHQAVRAAQRAGLSPGPTCYTAAIAELAGGSLAAAAGFAGRGVRASEQEGDTLYLRRNLHALGQAELRAGRTRDGVTALRRLRDLEAGSGGGDPMIVRWHGDLAGGLAALGEQAEAAATLAAARAAADRLGGQGLHGYLDRAAAVVLSESGHADSAVQLSAAAAQHFARLHQPIEQAHALLVQGSAERRRRRYAAARLAIGAALAIFLAADAKPWAEQTERALAGASAAGTTPLDLGLTSTELRIAALVRDGASNREIAVRLYLSVKTVEATLTRIYRKLGVRSRTQLSSRMATVVSEVTKSA